MTTRIVITEVFTRREEWQCDVGPLRCIHRHRIEVVQATVVEFDCDGCDPADTTCGRIGTPPVLHGVNRFADSPTNKEIAACPSS